MGRFHYSPIDYKEYMNKYINSLMTGEILIDFEGADIYVSEEGYNIPLPSNKKLKDDIIKYLENTIEGINFRTKTIPTILDKINKLTLDIQTRYNEILNGYDSLSGNIKDDIANLTYITKVTENNIQQLGDIKLTLDKNEANIIDKKIFKLVDQFNIINNDSRNKIYVIDAQNKNKQLMEIWNEIKSMMDEANRKLTRLGKFEGTVTLKRKTTSSKTAYDAYYSKRQFNFTVNGGHGDIGFPYYYNYASTEAQFLDFTKKVRAGFIKWFYGQKYLDPLTRVRFPNDNGSGFWYKGFNTKIDIKTGRRIGRRNPSWDLFEGVPLKGQLNQTNKNNFNIQYIRSATNFTMFDGGFYKGAKSPKNYTSESIVIDSKLPCYIYNGSLAFQRDYRHLGNRYYVDQKAIKNIIASDNGTQRLPKYKFNNKDRMSCISGGCPTFPIVTRDIPFISHTGLANKEAMVIRIGVMKTLNQTELKFTRMKLSDSKGWIKA